MRNFNDEQFILFFANQHPQLFHDVAGAFHEFAGKDHRGWHQSPFRQGLSPKERTPLHRGKRLDVATDIALGRGGHGGRVSPEEAIDSFYTAQGRKARLARHGYGRIHPTNRPSRVRAEGKRVQGLLAGYRKDDPNWISSPSSKARSRRSARQAESRPATVGPNRKAAFKILKKSHPDKTLGQINRALDRQNIRNSEFEEFASDPTQSGLDRIRKLDRYEKPIREKTHDLHKGGVNPEERKPSIEEVQERLDWSKIPKPGKKDMSEFYEFGSKRKWDYDKRLAHELGRPEPRNIAAENQRLIDAGLKASRLGTVRSARNPSSSGKPSGMRGPASARHTAIKKGRKAQMRQWDIDLSEEHRDQSLYGRGGESRRQAMSQVPEKYRRTIDPAEDRPFRRWQEFSHLNEFDCKRRVALGRKMLRFMEGSYA